MSKIAWAIIIVIGVLVILAIGVGVFFFPMMSRGVAFGARPFMMGGFGLAWPFLLLRGVGSFLFWLLVFAGIFLIFRSLAGRPSTSAIGPATSESPLDILKRRYAKGEINKEQYEEMRSTLGG